MQTRRFLTDRRPDHTRRCKLVFFHKWTHHSSPHLIQARNSTEIKTNRTYGDSEIRSTTRKQGPILNRSFSRNSFFSHRARRKRKTRRTAQAKRLLETPAPIEKAARVKRKALRKRRVRLHNLQFSSASRCPQTALGPCCQAASARGPVASARCERRGRRT